MARNLSQRRIPLLINGSIDTKSNPKLVQAPALLELENMYQLLTGQMTPRNGFSAQSAVAGTLSSPSNLFVTKNGGLATIGTGAAPADANVRALRYGNTVSGRQGWAGNIENLSTPSNAAQSYPNVTAQISGLPSGYSAGLAGSPVTDPDMCIVGGAQHVAWTNGTDAKVWSDLRDVTDARQLSTGANLLPTTAAVRPPLVASTGGNWAALFYSSAANTLNAVAYNPVSGVTTALAIAVDLAALPWFDVKAIPSTNNFAVAYRANAGGIKCGIYNPSASTFTSVVATAGADSSFCLGWLDNQFTAGNMYLATAGSGSGVVVRTMAAATMVVSATNVIDAAATANIRNITGHLYASGKFIVLWDVAGATTIADGTKLGFWDGGAAFAGSFTGGPHTLYSRSVRFADGKYRFLGCFASPVQPMFTLFVCDPLGASTVGPVGVQCHVLSGEAAARRSQCSLTTPISIDGQTVTMALARARSITTPDGGKTAPVKTTALATFTIMRGVTHAREVGNTVFVPGGLVYRDDGATVEPATFPIYPEAPTGATSAAGGSLTPSANYLWRVMFRAQDAAGRTYWSAGSVPLSLTLGAGDNRATLAVWGLSLPRGDTAGGLSGFGQVTAEIYRRGPAASGATLYNKVGEVLADSSPLAPTIPFVDAMSDANAALGAVAYFNGNVLENFHPPSHTVLEVNGNRVGLINAEDPTEFWFSKEYKAGTGIGFNPLLKVAISGDGAGGMTALASMDGRWILFKRSAIYVLSGDGPNDLGQGSFNAPQVVSRTLGTINPASIIETPDGIMFQALSGGIWLLDRGLGLSYVGAPVEGYMGANPTIVVGAALTGGVAGSGLGMTTVRFVLGGSSGFMLEWDYYHKRWYVHVLRVGSGSIVGCANSPLFGWCYLLDSGDLMKEIQDQAGDVLGTTTPVIPRVSFPHLQLAGLAGYQRLYSIDFTIEVIGNHTLSVDAEYNFSGGTAGAKSIPLTTATPTAQVEYNPPDGSAKCTSVRPIITVTGSPAAGTFRLTGATATIGVKRGSNVTETSRMT